MVKKILKIAGGLLALILVLIIAASIAIIVIVNKELVENQMKKALHRHVQIEDISVGIFSVISGIEVKNVKISNFKTEKELDALKGKPVPQNDTFVSLKAFKLKLKFIPLLKKNFELNELVLYEPSINVVKSAAGGYNFDDLLQPKKMTPEEKAAEEKKKAEEAKKAKEEPAKPFTADDIPVAVSVGKIGTENATITYYDQKFDQTFQVYGLTALVKNIKIDPKDLKSKDSMTVDVSMGVRTIGKVRSGSVQSFNIKFDIDGRVIPFDLKTRKLDPEAILKVGSPDGSITGLQIFDKIAGIEILNKYLGKHLSFLKGTTEWKGSKAAYVNAWYKSNIAKLSNGNVNAKEVRILFDGTVNTASKALDVNLELQLPEKNNKTVKVALRQQIESGMKKLGAKKYVNADKITDAAFKPFVNEKGIICMKFKVTGTANSPKTDMTKPALKSLDEVIKSMAGDVLKEAAQDAAKKAVTDGVKKIKIPKIKF